MCLYFTSLPPNKICAIIRSSELFTEIKFTHFMDLSMDYGAVIFEFIRLINSNLKYRDGNTTLIRRNKVKKQISILFLWYNFIKMTFITMYRAKYLHLAAPTFHRGQLMCAKRANTEFCEIEWTEAMTTDQKKKKNKNVPFTLFIRLFHLTTLAWLL